MIRLAIRTFSRAPGFTAAAVLILALGIGLTTAVFTIAHTMLIRRLPVTDQEKLVVLWGEPPDRNFAYPLSLDDARQFARESRSLDRVAFHIYQGSWPTPFREGDRVTQLRLTLVSGDFFSVLGAQPLMGRALKPEDDLIGAAPVAVLSYAAWRQHFGGRADVVGRTLVHHQTNGTYTIVGVMPAGLDYPRGVELWASTIPAKTRAVTDSAFAAVTLVGRLHPGATPVNAQDELTRSFRRSKEPLFVTLSGVAIPFPRLIVGEVRPAVIAFTLAACLLLLITCLNVANLLFVRGLARLREMAVRSAIGASRARIIVQLVTENSLLAAFGGMLGILVAAAAIQTFVRFAPPGLPRLDEIGVNVIALGISAGITMVATLLFGLAPALLTSRVGLERALRSDLRQSSSRATRVASETLVAIQIMLAVVVLAGAGVMVRSFEKLEHADLAFDPAHLLLADLSVGADQFDNRDKQFVLLDRILEAVGAIPGVRGVSPVVAMPYGHGWSGRPSRPDETPDQAAREPMINMDVVTPGYFGTLGIPILRGRPFTAADRAGTPRSVILSASAARHYWPHDDPIGQRLRAGGPDTATVIGIVPDIRYRDLRNAMPSIYFALRQSIFPFAPTTLVISVAGRPADVTAAVRQAVAAVSPAVAVSRAAPFDEFLEGPLAEPRLDALLLAVFAVAALLLAAIGLYGIMSSAVAQQTRELGVRLALGATPDGLRKMVLGHALTVTGAGAALGLVGALAGSRLLASMLFQVSPTDPATLIGVSVLLLTVALLAAYLPARRATRIDPARALRAE